MINKLLSHPKADINMQNSKGASVLYYTSYKKPEYTLIVIKLIKKKADISIPNSKKQYLLQLMC